MIHQWKSLHQYYCVEIQKFDFFFQKRLKLNFNLYFDLCRSAEITLASSMSVLQYQLVHDWRGFHEYLLQHGNPKNLLSFKKMLTLVFLLPCFVNNFYLMLCILISLFSYAIHKYSSRSQHISVLTICTFIFWQFCTIEPSFFNATSGKHRLPIEGRHIVLRLFYLLFLSLAKM